MYCVSNGGRAWNVGEPTDLYALVIYLPDPLGHFLDSLRLELVPGCNPHAHVSVLPPRPLPVDPAGPIEQARTIVAGFPPFDVELGQVEVFEASNVIYISVERGAPQLRRMHQALNYGTLAFEEPYEYHPHITLAQEIAPGDMPRMLDLTVRRWHEFAGPRAFRAGRTVFVRNTCGNRWVDLAEGPLQAVMC
jgi:hypothetical protein